MIEADPPRMNAPASFAKDQLRAIVERIERLEEEWVSLYGVERMRFEAVQRMSTEMFIAKIGNPTSPATSAAIAGQSFCVF